MNSKSLFTSKNLWWGLFALYVIWAFFLCFTKNGTYDDGDSVFHFLFAKYAPHHLELFLDHWAKPFFVLCASPFAQFNFTGIKVFNVLNSMVAIYCCYQSALRLKMENAFMVVILFASTSFFLPITLSGLTEPMFAAVLSLSLYLYLSNRTAWFAIVISFLPFVRSEGLIMIGVFGIIMLLKRQWKYIPLLGFGHLVYGLVGYPHYHSVFWVFTQIPYVSHLDNYGKGTWDHFYNHFPDMLGVPMAVFLAIGLAQYLYRIYNYFQKQNDSLAEIILVFFGFLIFFFAHTAFWALGLFHSFGLLRVFVGVMPLIVLIILRGFNSVLYFIPEGMFKKVVWAVLLFWILYFPFCGSPQGYKQYDFILRPAQACDAQMGDYIRKNYPDAFQHPFYCGRFNLCMVLGLDTWNDTQFQPIYNLTGDKVPASGSLVLWDNWYSVVECGVPWEKISSDPRLEHITDCNVTIPNSESRLVLFRVR